jgi:hypothetical protein
LTLEHCNKIESLQGLQNIPNVEVIHCTGLDSPDGLGNNQRIMFQCDRETTVEFFSRGATFDRQKYEIIRDSLQSPWDREIVLLRKQ